MRPVATRSCVFAARKLAVLAASLLLSGCETLGYYAQAVDGQLDVIDRSRPVAEVIDDPSMDVATVARLRRLPSIRRFAVAELGLPESTSYERYVDLERSAMVWSVVAAPFDSLEPHRWCYPIVGCASYRGYFAEQAAQEYAQKLADGHWDVAVEPVPAYSTLGWFSDPLPSTVASWPIAQIAGLVFHELAHETLYVSGDTAFNEAYATLVEREGARRWLLAHGTPDEQAGNRLRFARFDQFVGLLARARFRLEVVYAGSLRGERLAEEKARVFDTLRAEYRVLKAEWRGYAGYDRWMGRSLNNAHIASVNTYYRYLPALQELLSRHAGDMPAFHRACRRLAALQQAEREHELLLLHPDGQPVSTSMTVTPGAR